MKDKNVTGMTLAELKSEYDKIIKSDDHTRKIEICTQIVKLDPNDAYAFNNRGIVYASLKQFDKAIEDYDKAIDLNPKYAKAFYNRGNAYTHLKQFEKAIEDYDKAIDLNPKYANAFYNRGVAYRKMGDEEKAIESLKAAADIDPTIITQENIKELEKEFVEKIEQTQASNKEVQGFQDILKELEDNCERDEKNWGVGSVVVIVLMVCFLISGQNLMNGLPDVVYVFDMTSMPSNMSFYTAYVFFSIITYTVIRQYTNAKALRIEASNRVAMAKMFERVKHENNDYQKEFLPKLSDAIVYSTIKEKNDSNGLVEKIINGLEKLRK
ncbi:tetratricopeptide repeat protein [Bathymodiolus septemdierum thioautotrophic gill symbiont]|uniref:Uncharacterized protein n=1 Tax=endosymbiont of Bathymodiolus septemdierum str. Myojin knoll TaxID=1303921 RepID=A0A0N7KBL5_9GAMM|nr:tetratricopeptide repeat protein [Bathymodiolus septemdierum thioautotrophic gill symbiont]BAS68351.1 hypothetical protein BSEPE_1368 [endosymbiont of Bathymodiolus septemdierum str. Myojin knoll]